MNREIKFRAWIGDRFVSPILWDGLIFIDGRAFEDGISANIPIMQYTGLLDRNGREIYEGDIVKWKSEHNRRATDFHIDQVQFRSGYWNLHPWIHELYSTDESTIEIIGNIYEHPELLGE